MNGAVTYSNNNAGRGTAGDQAIQESEENGSQTSWTEPATTTIKVGVVSPTRYNSNCLVSCLDFSSVYVCKFMSCHVTTLLILPVISGRYRREEKGISS